jgi:hypothetical protein
MAQFRQAKGSAGKEERRGEEERRIFKGCSFRQIS